MSGICLLLCHIAWHFVAVTLACTATHLDAPVFLLMLLSYMCIESCVAVQCNLTCMLQSASPFVICLWPLQPGLRSLQGQQQLEDLVKFVKNARDDLDWGPGGAPPILIKIAPDLTDNDKADIAAVVTNFKVDGLVIGNTTLSRPGERLTMVVNTCMQIEQFLVVAVIGVGRLFVNNVMVCIDLLLLFVSAATFDFCLIDHVLLCAAFVQLKCSSTRLHRRLGG